ncbi:terminase small subunit [Neoroseomonas oryzicola]|uniref:Terminase small subunit n=1 Tax=Neoroseomonas oryzicola TaxID=535904 RepID=A0A9X9WLI6_9PROT|nr:terminase small subunit [Neoroseomonas oryzicola]MBR0661196.1 terminase small subunit [Neoroseomonas oryzicola]NKE17561.1 terminase small subunit [Neoroseomonas oryzicola]
MRGDLTEQQAAFVFHYTSDPACLGNGSASARAAGYSDESAGEIARQLLEKPHVRAAVDAALRSQISGRMAVKASRLLERVIDDEDAPLKVRVEAAKTILDRGGFVAPSAFEKAAEAARREGKTVNALTLDELRAEIAAIAQSAVPMPAGGRVIDVEVGELVKTRH